MKITTLLFTLFITISLSFGQNLIDNGDFETPGMAADPVPAPWGGFKNRIVNDSTVSSFVGQVENGDGSLFQEFSVTPGDTFIVNLDYKWVNSGSANTTMTVRVKDANMLSTNLDLIGGTTSDGFKLETVVDQWFVNQTFSFSPPMGVDSVRLLFFKGNGNKSVNFDNISVRKKVPCTDPVVDFSIADTSDLTLTFDNQSMGTDSLSYVWDFGDGDTATMMNPMHSYDSAGTYVVCLTVTDGCGMSTSCDSITVTGDPCQSATADFSITDTSGLMLTFSNLSSNPGTDSMTYVWTFGDGNSSTEEAPIHTYDSSGTYQVCLEVTTQCGTVTDCDSIEISGSAASVRSGIAYELSVYPNPVSHFVKLKSSKKLDRFEVINMRGQKVMMQELKVNEKQLDLSAIPTGLYLLNIYVDGAVNAIKILKE